MARDSQVQVCRNGHLTNYNPRSEPQNNKNFCPKCGEPTLLNCPNCQAEIEDEGYMIFQAPNYCKNCGKPFPWTDTKLKAAHELVQGQDKLSEEDRKILDSSIDDLVKDTPTTTLSANRAKTILAKAGPAVFSMFRDILVDIVSETARKIVFPDK